jgi:glycine dehydrogenase subunit 1
MDFISNQEFQNKEMLKVIGVQNVEELFSDIPESLKLPKIALDDGICEYEGIRLMQALAAKNTFSGFDNYLGAGAYQHHVPAITSSICSKAEFLTSYTPYQPEASQGMLQVIFEFQSAICALTGMDVANASLYDGASACAEAMLMSLRIHTDRNKVLIAENLHPHYKQVVIQYLCSHHTNVQFIPMLPDGSLDINQMEHLIDDQTAAVLVQYPNFFGGIDDVSLISKKAKSLNVLTILSANPMVYGLYKSAAELESDIAVGDCQPFGLPLQFGGPFVGYIACKQEHIRQLPGRIVGETLDTKGRTGFVLTLQAREQHIRREKATSNICTNQALAALATLVGMLWYGKEGVKKVALTNYQRTAYLREKLNKLPGVNVVSQKNFFNEFVIRFDRPLDNVIRQFRENKIEPGLNLTRYYPAFKDHLLVAVTETKNLDDLNRYISIARG